MRRALQVLALLGVGFALISWEAGRRAEGELRALVEAMDGESPISVAVDRYERGIFRSHAVTTVAEPEGPFAGAQRVRVRLRHEIDHGPLPLSYLRSEDFDGTPIVARAATAATLEREGAEEIEEMALPLSIESLFRRDGSAIVWIVADPELAGAGEPAVSGDWEELYAEFAFRYDGSKLSGELEVPRIEVKGEGGAFALHDLRYVFDYERISEVGPIYVGESQVHLGLLRVEAEGEVFELRGLELRDESGVEGSTWSVLVQSSFDRLRGGGRTHGPGDVELRLSGLALEPLAELGELGRRLESEEAGGEAAGTEVMLAMGALWPRFMAAEPSFEMPRLRLVTADGELRMALRLGVDTSEPMFLAHPMTSLPALEFDAELSLPETLLHRWLATPRPVMEVGSEMAPWVAPAEMASQRVAAWLERGYIQRQGESYALAVRVRKGAIRLNGRVVSVDQL